MSLFLELVEAMFPLKDGIFGMEVYRCVVKQGRVEEGTKTLLPLRRLVTSVFFLSRGKPLPATYPTDCYGKDKMFLEVQKAGPQRSQKPRVPQKTKSLVNRKIEFQTVRSQEER